MAVGPAEVEAAVEVAARALARAVAPADAVGSRTQWAAVAGSLQRVIDMAGAAQDAAIARLAAIEPELLEDGTEVDSHRGLGHVALDTPAILSGVLNVSAVHAERRVRAAVALAADGPAGTTGETGLSGLHAAMGAGRLDAYRASVLAEELEAAPAQVRATVVAALEGHFDREDGAHLRRRCRRVLARISPDLLRQRALRARAGCGLRRWVDEPGVDRWEGTFPSEDAAQAWAAIDALARRLVADGVCATVERARSKALTDLVAGNATVETVLTVTVPATGLAPEPVDYGPGLGLGDDSPVEVTDDLVEVTGPHGAQPVFVSRDWLNRAVVAPATDASRLTTATCHPVTGALLDEEPFSVRPAASADVYRPCASLVERVKARDRRCRFPGCTVSAVFCDVDHVRPWPSGRTALVNLMCLCRRHHRVKQRPGWRVALAADGVATWTDPTGRVRTTHPVNALHTLVLAGAGPSPRAPVSASHARTVVPDGAHSALEFLLQHVGAPPRHVGASPQRVRASPRHVGASPRRPPPVTTWRDDTRYPHRTEVVPPRRLMVLGHDGEPSHGPRRAPRPCVERDGPPF